jgi:anthranilate phosphoribosyltransferase
MSESMDIKAAIATVVSGADLTRSQMYAVMDEIMSGAATDAQIGSFLTGLRMKGETVAEITGAVQVMREKVTPIDPGLSPAEDTVIVDTCGTGGDGSGTFNVSTTAAFVVAGCGVMVAKHGNRAVSSACGSADVLEAAGVNLAMTSEQTSNCLQTVGISFLFAPALHPAMKHAIGPRREVGIRTMFNILGPLTNPAGANVQVMGVFDRDLVTTLAQVLNDLGTRRALVVHGEGNLDELTTTGTTLIAEVQDGAIATYSHEPEDFGLTRATLGDLQGGATAAESAEIMRGVLAGAGGPRRDMVLLNAGAALMAAGVCDTIAQGIEKAAACIDSGAALAKLIQLIDFSKTSAPAGAK